MEEFKSKVYIKLDSYNNIVRCEGGYTTPSDLTDWIEIDSGTGDKYNLCQSHYFDGGLYALDGIPRYKYIDGQCILRTDKEIQADIQVDIESLKNEKILQNEQALADYLDTHPLTWIDGNQYSVTKDKQLLLASQIQLYQISVSAGIPYTVKWNTTNNVCTEWTIENLSALALAIGEYIRPIVTYQQTIDVAIRSCTTQEELNDIIIDYSSVVNSGK